MQIMIKPEIQNHELSIIISLEKEKTNSFSFKIYNGRDSADLPLTEKDMHQIREAIGFLLDLY